MFFCVIKVHQFNSKQKKQRDSYFPAALVRKWAQIHIYYILAKIRIVITTLLLDILTAISKITSYETNATYPFTLYSQIHVKVLLNHLVKVQQRNAMSLL